MATITKKPNIAVKSLSAPSRESGTYKMSAGWKVPNDLTKSSNSRRATGLKIHWTLDIENEKDPKKTIKTSNENTETSTVNLNNFVIKNGNTTVATYTRSSFHPVVAGNYLNSVSVKVVPYNSKGNGSKSASATREFKVPPVPTISEPSFNTSNGVVSATISVNTGDDYEEQYQTKYEVCVKTRTASTETIASSGVSQSSEFTLTYNATDYQNLSTDQYISVTFRAWSQGLRGDSQPVTRTCYVSHAAKTTIKSTSAPSNTGTCMVLINTNESTEHPVDTVSLEYLANVTYEKESDIPATGITWSESGIEDDGDCTALVMPVTNLIPDAGKYTWVRVKSWHLHEGVLYQYSNYVRVTDLEKPTPVVGSVGIISATSGNDGQSAIVQLGWNSDDATGTEISWSDSEDTWRSTEEPSHYEFTWSDGRYPATGTQQYSQSALITIKGLTEATKYYVKARRYLDGGDDGITYSAYAGPTTVLPHAAPSSVYLTCDKYVSVDTPLNVRWTLSGGTLQTGWRLVTSNGKDLGNGESSIGATQISADKLKSVAVSGSVTFTVEVTTGSDWVKSNSRTVTIISKPTLALAVPSTMTSQAGFSFTATSDKECDLIVIVTSQGISGQFPQGLMRQTAGDTIYSNKYHPAWTTSNGSKTTTITFPKGLDFWDNGEYEISVVAVDRMTQLQSKEVKKSFNVNWTNKAVDPSTGVTLTVLNDPKGAVQITLRAPTGSNATDVFDIYRMDVENPTLISGKNGFPRAPSEPIIDYYAPFGSGISLYYRIALRTIDGDVEFADIEYTAQNKAIRFDWADGSLELPYGLSIGDSYSKDFEIRHHMDGSSDGYWNPNIERKSSLSSSVIKLIQPDDIEKARKLARYAGPVFVRLPDGSAYEADVQVTDLSKKNEAVAYIAIDATEIGLTEEFSLASPYSYEEATS